MRKSNKLKFSTVIDEGILFVSSFKVYIDNTWVIVYVRKIMFAVNVSLHWERQTDSDHWCHLVVKILSFVSKCSLKLRYLGWKSVNLESSMMRDFLWRYEISTSGLGQSTLSFRIYPFSINRTVEALAPTPDGGKIHNGNNPWSCTRFL